MEKNTRTKNILLVVLLIAVLTLSISYAALSQYLYINSSATVGGKSTGWNVAFTDVSCAPTGYAAVTTPFTATATTLNGLVVTLRAPGDSVVCDVEVTNGGAIDADLSTFTLQDGSLTYTGSGDNKTADEALVNGKLVYTIVYAENDDEEGNVPGDNGVDDTLAAGAERHLTLTIAYPDTETELPDNDVTISGIRTTFLYVQN